MENASKQTRRRWYRRPSRIIPVVFAVALAIGVPVAWATFTDVPPSNPFYADINAIQGAGITAGCGGGNFCPTDNITRQAEAAFVHRAASRVGSVFSGVSVAQGSQGVFTDMGSFNLTVGGVAGNQFVTVVGGIGIVGSSANCPCNLTWRVLQDGTVSGATYFGRINQTTYDQQTLNFSHTFVATAGRHTYTLQVAVYQTGSGFSFLALDMSGMTQTFGSTGGNAQAVSSQSQVGATTDQRPAAAKAP